MSNKRLPQEQELQLLKKLSSDDDYRARFEKDPAAALKEIGVSETDIANIGEENLKPGRLAEKATILKASNTLGQASVSEHVCLVIPFMRLTQGFPKDES